MSPRPVRPLGLLGPLGLLSVAALVLLAGCGKEVGRVALTGEGSGEGTMTFAPGEVRFWTDLDLDFDGDAALSYRVELLRDGARIAETECDPLGPLKVKLAWVETNLGDHHTRRGRGRMECSVSLDRGGPLQVRAKLHFSRKPARLELKKADLVVKQ